jgi:hypothetical protein
MEGHIEKVESDSARAPKLVTKPCDAFDRLHDALDAEFAETRKSIAQLSLAVGRYCARVKVAAIETWIWRLLILGGIWVLAARTSEWI